MPSTLRWLKLTKVNESVMLTAVIELKTGNGSKPLILIENAFIKAKFQMRGFDSH